MKSESHKSIYYAKLNDSEKLIWDSLDKKLEEMDNRENCLLAVSKGLCDDNIRQLFLNQLSKVKTIDNDQVLSLLLDLRYEAGYLQH